MASIKVKVIPNAKQTKFADWVPTSDGEALRIRLAAPPVDGKANQALIAFLAKSLGVGKSSITVARGEKSRLKTLQINGISDADLQEKIEGIMK